MPLELDGLVDLYDRGRLSRRQLVQGILAIGIAPTVTRGRAATPQSASLFRTRTVNHVTVYASDVARSKAFYQRLTGLPVRSEDSASCEFRLENGFFGIYAPDRGQRFGFNHFCFGIEKYDPQTAVDAIKRAIPRRSQLWKIRARSTFRIRMASVFSSQTSTTNGDAADGA